MKIAKQVIASMLTENTGRHLLDSGGAYGRNWERNQGLDLDHFESRPAVTLEVSEWRDGQFDLSPTIDLFHHLKGCLEWDELCQEFSDLGVADWDASSFYGVSSEGEEWLLERFKAKGDSFNSYNWSANFSQVIQGDFLEDLDSGDTYLLLQIHGGCDVRGGYTNARLFKLRQWCEEYSVLSEDCGFWAEDSEGEMSLSWTGSEWIADDGGCADDEYLNRFARAVLKGETRATTQGDLFTHC